MGGNKGGAKAKGGGKGGKAAAGSSASDNEPAKGKKGGGKGDMKNCNQVKARHILTEKEGKIRDAYAVLKQNYLDEGKKVPAPKFAELAKACSECSSAKAGGNLGWFPRGKMVGAFEQKAFATPVGELTEPFKSPSGWHIVMVEGRKA